MLIVLPILLVNVPWWLSLLGFIIMHMICGLVLALIFQPAHVIEETDFFAADEEGSVENNWAIHQMKTTANFANGSIFFSWFIGGLNFQIEHHLFPNICHVHYKKISKIVRETAQEFSIPYHHHKTFAGAVISHFSLIHQLGTGSYDKKMALARAKR
jgi:linoleoyl-CoA desaturase